MEFEHPPPPLTVLVVDDEQQFLSAARTELRSEGFDHVITCSDPRQVLEVMSQRAVALVLLDNIMPHLSGREVLSQIGERFPQVPVIMVTALDDAESAVDAMRCGAADYLVKPVDTGQLRAAVERWVEIARSSYQSRLVRDCRSDSCAQKPAAARDLVTEDAAMCAMLHYAVGIAPCDRCVLITGETGVGKELVARLVHEQSGRTGKLVAINAGGTDTALLADRLFGHVRGAFTGADAPRAGVIEKAQDGTVLLDEIGDLDLESQIKLLRLLQNREFYPLGADRPKNSRARILATTNRDLHEMARNGAFRQDLLYRLSAHEIHVPPLRERPGDLPLLLAHFVANAAAELGKAIPEIPAALSATLSAYEFPGNVRQLEGMVFDAMSQHRTGPLSSRSFLDKMGASALQASGAERGPPALIFRGRLPTLDELGDLLIEEASRRAGGDRAKAAALIGITRQALNMRISRRNRRTQATRSRAGSS